MRVDSGVAAGSVVSPLYDPMVAKLIVRGVDREDAIGRMLRALGEFEIGGVKTLIGFHKALLEHPCFRAGETCHGIVESPELAARAEELGAEPVRGAAPAATAAAARPHRAARDRGGGRRPARDREGGRARGAVSRAGPPPARARGRGSARPAGRTSWRARCREPSSRCRWPTATSVEVGQVLCIVEAMKMENEVVAHRAGTSAASP